jgi:hypothetical protein
LGASEFDVTEGGVSAVLLATNVATYDTSLALVSTRVIEPGYQRVAHADTTEAWMAAGSLGFLHVVGFTGTPESVASLGVAAATNFAVLGADGEHIWRYDADSGIEIEIPIGSLCTLRGDWVPSAMGGLRAIAVRSSSGCERFAVASSSTIWVSDGSLPREASNLEAECFVGRSDACDCPVTPPATRLPDMQFGWDIALGRAGLVATTSDIGVRFPGFPDLRPLEVLGGARSVSMGALPGSGQRFMVAYVDPAGVHLRDWGPDVQCRPPVSFDLPGVSFSKVRISDCIDGVMTLGVLQKEPARVLLYRLTCG